MMAKMMLALFTALSFDARTTDGRHVTYPDAVRGKPLILVVGFDRSAADASAAWTAELQRRVGARATVVGVAVLDRVPRFVRGWVLSAIDREIGRPKPGDASFVTTFSGEPLRARAPAGNDAVAVLYVFDASGTIVAIERRAYSEADATAIASEVP